ncbi:hypothetical protein GCM10020256_29120 [Streptomyces thermocoprophilus]
MNPSLTITAQAERAMSYWPNKGEDDPRPAQHEPYRRLTPIEPKHPVVPPGSLRRPAPPVPGHTDGAAEGEVAGGLVRSGSGSRPRMRRAPRGAPAGPFLRQHRRQGSAGAWEAAPGG